jgi:hypothetical protein
MKTPVFAVRLMAAVACALILICFGAAPSHADKRVALIIGNGAYARAPHLPNPAHDAEDVAAALKRIGFETIVGTDLNQNGMQNIAIRFARVARTADVALFYYSGHAIQYAGVNYLMPIDAELHDEADLRRMARVDEILADLQQAKNLRILVLDSCRDNPLADQLKRSIGSTRSANIGRGLARMESPDGTIVSYSTQAGRTAEDGKGRNSPYTGAFLKHIGDKEDIAAVFQRISANVYETTKGTQVPELSLSFFGELYLNGKVQITAAPTAVPPAASINLEVVFWDSIKASHDPADLRAYLARFPNGVFVDLAQNRLARLQEAASKPSSISTPHDALLAILARHVFDTNERESQARDYQTDEVHKAIALSVEGHHSFRTARWTTAEAAEIGALEGCQLVYVKPCTLIAVDDRIEPSGNGPPIARDLPRLHYAGRFNPEQIPRARPELILRQDVLGYTSAPGPKAAALHPEGQLVIIIGGDQFEAEESALSQCNSDPVRKGRTGPCFLYAVGNQVVLPQRYVKPITARLRKK